MSWISVKDEQPPCGTAETFALVIDHKSEQTSPVVREAFRWDDGRYSISFLHEPTVWQVTHWQRLPVNGRESQ